MQPSPQQLGKISSSQDTGTTSSPSPVPRYPPALGNLQVTSCPYRFAQSGDFLEWIKQSMVFHDWLLSLSIMFSIFIDVVKYISPSLLFIAKYSTVLDDILFIHSPVNITSLSLKPDCAFIL